MMQAGLALMPNAVHAPWNPEIGHTVSQVFAIGDVLDGSALTRFSTVLFGMDFTGLNGSGGGLIVEVGGSGNAFYAGFQQDGQFLTRCGKGGALPLDTAAWITAPAGEVAGDGTLHIACMPGIPLTMQAWWNGTPIGTAVSGDVGNSVWSGGGTGGYLRPLTGGLPEGVHGETIPAFASASGLRLIYGYHS